MRHLGLTILFAVATLASAHAQDTLRLELNTVETVEKRCRMTFVIENKGAQTLESFKLDFALFNTDNLISGRMIADMGPVRAAKTVVRTYLTDGDCAQLGALLVNDVTACTPGEPNACLDALALSSRVKAVRFYK